MRSFLAPLALLAATAGCLAPMEPLDMDLEMDFSSLEWPAAHLGPLRHDASYDLTTLTARVHVEGEVLLARNVSEPRVAVYLARGGCPWGPAGVPQAYEDSAVFTYDTPQQATRHAFEAHLSARILPGTEYAVYAHAEPHGLEPGFAQCETFVAGPV